MPQVTRLDDQVVDCFVLEGDRYHDDRGFFTELFNESKAIADINTPIPACKQVSMSCSKANVLRGIHTSPYSKLVACISGRLVDYVVDLREESPTYLTWLSVELTSENGKQLYVPPRCGHMFVALEDNTTMCYIQGGSYDADFEMEVNYKDPQLKITLPHKDDTIYIVSQKDKLSPMLDEAQKMHKEKCANRKM